MSNEDELRVAALESSLSEARALLREALIMLDSIENAANDLHGVDSEEADRDIIDIATVRCAIE